MKISIITIVLFVLALFSSYMAIYQGYKERGVLRETIVSQQITIVELNERIVEIQDELGIKQSIKL